VLSTPFGLKPQAALSDTEYATGKNREIDGMKLFGLVPEQK